MGEKKEAEDASSSSSQSSRKRRDADTATGIKTEEPSIARPLPMNRKYSSSLLARARTNSDGQIISYTMEDDDITYDVGGKLVWPQLQSGV